MAKVKRSQPLEGGSWELGLGGVQHTSRWGTIARSKGSTLRYYPNCPWEKPPKRPPPEPRYLLVCLTSRRINAIWGYLDNVPVFVIAIPTLFGYLGAIFGEPYIPGMSASIEAIPGGFRVCHHLGWYTLYCHSFIYGERYRRVRIPEVWRRWQYLYVPYSAYVPC